MGTPEKELNLPLPMFKWNGSFYPTVFMKVENLLSIQNMVPKEGDIFLASAVRCGSMWTQAIIWSILNSGQPLPQRLQIDFPHLELIDCNFLENMPTPRTFKTHLASRYVPKSTSAKYICIVRNIYDSCLSVYDFNSKNVKLMGGEDYVSLDRHVECFIAGLLPMGSFFDTCQSWYERRDDPNVLFLTYEEQRKDITGGILKIAKFLGSHYYDQISSNTELLNQIIHNTELKSMKDAKSYRFPDKGFSRDLEERDKEVGLQEVPLNETNSLAPIDQHFKGEVGRGLKGLSDKHRDLLREALEAKIIYQELKNILGEL